MITGVIAPMAAEYRTARALRRAGWHVAHAGVGPERARIAADTLLAQGAERLLVWGTAGGLGPDLRPGCVVLPDLVRDAEGRSYTLDPDWRERLIRAMPQGLSISTATIASVLSPVVTRAEKQALAEASGAVAVDMETAAIASFAQRHGIPCAAVRAIADPLELDLPSVVMAARSDRLLPLEIPARLFVKPREVPAIKALARAFSAARKSLEYTANEFAGTIQQI